MIIAAADTQSVIWYMYGDRRLTRNAKEAIDQAITSANQIAVSTVTLVEMVYLIEKRRIPPDAYTEVIRHLDAPGGVFIEIALDRRVANMISAVSRDEVPEMPDRIIAATALMLGVPLITSDRELRASAVPTIW